MKDARPSAMKLTLTSQTEDTLKKLAPKKVYQLLQWV